MKLYLLERIELIEATRDFAEARQKAEVRSSAATRGVLTKLEHMEEYIDGLVIEVPSIPRDELISRARQNLLSLDLHGDFEMSDEKMCVNYLRHRETTYEAELKKIAGRVGIEDAYRDLKIKVLDAIADRYDWLEEECSRQKL